MLCNSLNAFRKDWKPSNVHQFFLHYIQLFSIMYFALPSSWGKCFLLSAYSVSSTNIYWARRPGTVLGAGKQARRREFPPWGPHRRKLGEKQVRGNKGKHWLIIVLNYFQNTILLPHFNQHYYCDNSHILISIPNIFLSSCFIFPAAWPLRIFILSNLHNNVR